LLASPVNTKVGCCWLPLELLLVADEEVLAPCDEGRSIIQGTATCFPLLEETEELIPVLLLELEEELEPLLLLDSEITANSSLPDAGFTIVSLMVPT